MCNGQGGSTCHGKAPRDETAKTMNCEVGCLEWHRHNSHGPRGPSSLLPSAVASASILLETQHSRYGYIAIHDVCEAR